MGFIKNFARKILADEIKQLEDSVERYKKRNIELRGELAEVKKRSFENELEKSKEQKRTKELEKENEILRKYYDLDKEPSDEIKTKIHIDLEINRLKEELQLIAMCNRQPLYIPQPYPYMLNRF